jgi:symplekin
MLKALGNRRIGLGAQFAREINEAITLQTTRMDQAANDEFARRAAENRKRSLVNPEDDMLDAKRAKVEQPPRNLTPSVAAQTSTLLDFDFTALSTSLVTDLILANLLAVPEQKLQAAIEVSVVFPVGRNVY